MKTKTTYKGKTRMAKIIFAAVLFFIQASIIASDSSEVKQEFNSTNDGCIEFSISSDTGNTYDYLYEEAYEPEMEIEEWMYNIHGDIFNSQSDEEEYELEEWMYNTQHSFWLGIDETEESEPAIESWMTNPNEWTNNNDEFILTSK